MLMKATPDLLIGRVKVMLKKLKYIFCYNLNKSALIFGAYVYIIDVLMKLVYSNNGYIK